MALDHFDVTRNTTKTVLNAQGVLETVPANVPAFEFNADGTYKGCLIEPSATNLLLRSQEFDNAYWTKTALNTTGTPPWVNVAVAPDGTTTAERLIEDTSSNSLRGVHRNPGPLTGVYTISFFAKPNGRNKLNIVSDNQANVPLGINFDLTNGFTTTNLVVVDAGNGWSRVIATTGECSTAGTNIRIRLRDNEGNQSYTGDGTSGIFLWGAQIEEGSVATSYIPTTDSTATRNADVIAKTGATDLIGQTEGRIIFEVNQPGGLIQVANVGALAEAGIVKVEFRYTPTTQKLFFNDTEVASATGNYDWSGMNKIEIGHDDGSDQPTDVHYRLFSIYKTANP